MSMLDDDNLDIENMIILNNTCSNIDTMIEKNNLDIEDFENKLLEIKKNLINIKIYVII